MSERESEKLKRKHIKEKKPLTSRQKKMFNVVTTAILVVAVCVFVYSGYQLYASLKEYKDGQDAYNDLQSLFPTLGEVVEGAGNQGTEEMDKPSESLGTEGIVKPSGAPETEENAELSTSPETEGEEAATQATQGSPSGENSGTSRPSNPTPEPPVQSVDWAAFYQQMKEQNPDYIGWIIINDTKINYPMVQTTDNDYYLYRMFDGTDNRAGTLFADYRCKDVFKYRNTIIYGHNRYDGSMFANLRKYETDWFYNSHPTFYIYTEDGPVLYQIFSIYVTDPGSETYITRFADDEDYVEWLKERYALSRVKPDVVLDAETDIVTLSTCVNDSKDRLVVHAKRMN